MTKLNQKSSRGFTLVELSIVLVIIGLLAAGVLVGRDLIRAATIRAQISQIEKLNAALNTFRIKYNCLPGDCANAIDFGFGTVGGDGDNGNGNGLIEANGTDMANGVEVSNFWYHLSKALLIEKNVPYGNIPGTNSPPTKMTGEVTPGGIWLAPAYNLNGVAVLQIPRIASMQGWVMTGSSQPAVTSTRRGNFNAFDSYSIDVKMDDGLPLSGKVKALTLSWTLCTTFCLDAPVVPITNPTSSDLQHCIENRSGNFIYNLISKGPINSLFSLCAPRFDFS